MGVLYQWDGTAPISNEANWDPVLVGETGEPGPQGVDGPPGPIGNTGPAGPPPATTNVTRAAYNAIPVGSRNGIYIITDEGGSLLSGAGAPAAGTGFDGDFYINTSGPTLYGPKAGGTWPTGVSMVGGGGSSTRTIVTKSATSQTALITDAAAYIDFTGTNPTYTIPPNSSVAFPVGAQIEGAAVTTAMTIIQGSGVTITKARTLVTVGAMSGWTIIKVATDTWRLHGAFV